MRTGLHVCRGNWSRQEDVLLTGGSAFGLHDGQRTRQITRRQRQPDRPFPQPGIVWSQGDGGSMGRLSSG